MIALNSLLVGDYVISPDGLAIVIETDKDEVLTFARKYLKSSKYDKETYYNLYRDSSLSFHEHMTVVCEGYYELYRNKDMTGTYRVEQEYID